MTSENNKEFENALGDISFDALKLETSGDRVRVCEWVRKLSGLQDDCFETSKLRNEYAQYLRIMVRFGFLHGLFLYPPPSGTLKPLAESLGDNITKYIPDLPQCGPISPYLAQSSPDGRAYVSIKKIPDRGVFCYMCVTPDNSYTNDELEIKNLKKGSKGHE